MSGFIRKILSCFSRSAGDEVENIEIKERLRHTVAEDVTQPTNNTPTVKTVNEAPEADSTNQHDEISPIQTAPPEPAQNVISQAPPKPSITIASPQGSDPDEISPVQPPKLSSTNVSNAIEDRRKLFERLRGSNRDSTAPSEQQVEQPKS